MTQSRGRNKQWQRIGLGFLLGIFVFLWLGIAAPDSLFVRAASCYSHTIEVGDIFCWTAYEINYAALPTESINEAFIGQYLDNGTTPVQSVIPFAFVNQGFGNGVVSFYFSQAQVTSLGLVHGDATDRIQIIGNPGIFASPPSASLNIVWSSTILFVAFLPSTEDIEDDLQDQAFLLQAKAEWVAADITLVETAVGSNRATFTQDGESYFSTVIVNLRLMAPDLFATSIQTPTFVEQDHDLSYVETLDDFFVGSAFENTFVSLASLLNISEQMTKTLVGFILVLGITAFVGVTLTSFGIQGSLVVGSDIILFFLLTGLFAFIGWMDFRVIGAMGGLGIVVIGFVIFLRRGG